jgi:hypothetical protein
MPSSGSVKIRKDNVYDPKEFEYEPGASDSSL